MKNNTPENRIEAESNKRIKAGVLMSYMAIAINILSGLLYTPWILRQIGDSSYGLYTLASSFISMFMLDFGMSAAVSRFVSRYRALDDQEGINNFLGIVYKLYGLIAGVISIVLIVVFFNLNRIYANLSPGEISIFKVVYAMTACATVFCFPFITLNGILRSYEYFFQLKLCDLMNKICTVVCTIAVLMVHGGLYALVGINLGFNVVFVFVKLILISRKTSIKVNWKVKDWKLTKSIFGFSIWTAISTLSQQFTMNIMPSILAAKSGSGEVAHFSLARTIEGYVWILSDAINGLFLPKVTRKIVKTDSAEDVLPLMIKVGRIILSITGIIVLGIVIIGHDFVLLWLKSDQYNDVYYMMIILTVYSVLSSPQQIANTSMVALNKVRYQAIIYLSTAILNIACAPILIMYYGALGAAISIGGIYLLRTVVLNIVYYKVLKINVFSFFKNCHIKMLPGFAATAIGGICIEKFIHIGNQWINLVTKGVLLCGAYLIIMMLIGWNKEEKQLIKSIFKVK